MPNKPVAPVIYVVDADAGVREAMSRLVRSAGFDARPCETTEQLLSQVEWAASGCVLIDITVVAGDGMQLRQRLHQHGVDLPLIALSARDDAAMRHRARELGSRFFLSKPVDDQALLDAIHWVMETAANGTTTG